MQGQVLPGDRCHMMPTWHTGQMVMPCGAPGLRERKKLQTRAAIVDAALDLFERKGFEATTVEDIAAAADVSPRTFFRYFESKQDVVMVKNQEEGEGLAVALTQRPPDEPPVEALRNTITAQVASLESDDVMQREMRVMMGNPDLRAMALDHFHEHSDELARALAGRMRLPGDALVPRVLAGVVGTALWAVIDKWVSEGAEAARLRPMIDEVFDLLASGFDAVVASAAQADAAQAQAGPAQADAATPA
jgi:AcrR family transcriptional regulator